MAALQHNLELVRIGREAESEILSVRTRHPQCFLPPLPRSFRFVDLYARMCSLLENRQLTNEESGMDKGKKMDADKCRSKSAAN